MHGLIAAALLAVSAETCHPSNSYAARVYWFPKNSMNTSTWPSPASSMRVELARYIRWADCRLERPNRKPR